MARPAAGYRLADGTKVPGVTTITGRFKESGALIYWAWQQGKEGKDFRDTSKAAADAGTVAHSLVEADIKKEKADISMYPQEIQGKALAAFEAYLSWKANSKLEIFEQEMTMISERHKFGGTPDAVGYLDGKLSLLDWKSSNAVYSDYLIQVAAYKELWEENHPEYPITGGFHICRFAKEHGDFAHHYFPNLDEAWELFLIYRKAYDIDKQLRKRAA